MIKTMEFKTDYHMHSTYSMDGHDNIEALCWRALALGLEEIAVTEHAEWHPSWRSELDISGYLAEIERCRIAFAPRGLTVLSGVEIGNPHEYPLEAGALVGANPFDIRIASLHWLYGKNIHDAVCFAGREPLEVYGDYFVALGEMAGGFSSIDVVGHFDRILWRGTLLGAPFDLVSLEPLVRDALATIAWRGLALELNTRLLNHTPGWRRTLITMLQWFREEGGRRIVVNSDAHRVAHLGSNLELAGEILSEAGLAPVRLETGRVAYPA